MPKVSDSEKDRIKCLLWCQSRSLTCRELERGLFQETWEGRTGKRRDLTQRVQKGTDKVLLKGQVCSGANKGRSTDSGDKAKQAKRVWNTGKNMCHHRGVKRTNDNVVRHVGDRQERQDGKGLCGYTTPIKVRDNYHRPLPQIPRELRFPGRVLPMSANGTRENT